MKKLSLTPNNDYCPQTLFAYGTYKEDGAPNFGLFCWLSYCWDDALCVMCCIGEEKLTKDRILATGRFSACLITEPLLPLADYLGSTSGRDPGKMNVDVAIGKGARLDVPILEESPICYELEVKRTMPLSEGSTLFVCRIVNVLADARCAQAGDVESLLRAFVPVSTTCQTYFSHDGRAMGKWGEPGRSVRPLTPLPQTPDA